MSKVVKGVGKVFKKAAPVIVPLAITAATGGFGAPLAAGLTASQSLALTGPLGMMGGGIVGGATLGAGAGVATAAGLSAVTGQAMTMGSSIFSNLFKGSMSGDTMDLSSGVPKAMTSGSPKAMTGAAKPLIANSVGTKTGAASRVVDWIKENPELTKMFSGLISGAAEGYENKKDREA